MDAVRQSVFGGIALHPGRVGGAAAHGDQMDLRRQVFQCLHDLQQVLALLQRPHVQQIALRQAVLPGRTVELCGGAALGKHLVPKSPKNMLAKAVRRGK